MFFFFFRGGGVQKKSQCLRGFKIAAFSIVSCPAWSFPKDHLADRVTVLNVGKGGGGAFVGIVHACNLEPAS